MNKAVTWFLERAKERSTWIGLITVLSAAGVTLSSGQAEALATAGAALIGAILALTADPATKLEVSLAGNDESAPKPQWEDK